MSGRFDPFWIEFRVALLLNSKDFVFFCRKMQKKYYKVCQCYERRGLSVTGHDKEYKFLVPETSFQNTDDVNFIANIRRNRSGRWRETKQTLQKPRCNQYVLWKQNNAH